MRRTRGNVVGEGVSSSIIAQTLPIESAAKESASAEKTPIGGGSRESLSPGNLRGPGMREADVRAALGSGYTGEQKLSCLSGSEENDFPK